MNNYCYDHLGVHKDQLEREYYQVENDRITFGTELEELQNNPQNHTLMKKVVQWENDSISKIKQKADDVRKELLPHITSHLNQLQTKLQHVKEEQEQCFSNNDYNERNLREWQKSLQRLRSLRNNLRDFTIRLQPTSFVSEIYIEKPGEEAFFYRSK
jgi:chromosome segregation ATPase